MLSQHKDTSYVSRSKEMASYCKVGLISKEEFASQKAATGSTLDQESSEEELFFQMEGDNLQQQLSHSLPTTLDHDQKTSSASKTGHSLSVPFQRYLHLCFFFSSCVLQSIHHCWVKARTWINTVWAWSSVMQDVGGAQLNCQRH